VAAAAAPSVGRVPLNLVLGDKAGDPRIRVTRELLKDTKIVLIGGTSHVGKSTLGRSLADDLGWNYLSTDQLARHPGRPWKVSDRQVPDDVAEHYTSLSTRGLVDSVLLHYRNNVWPIINAIVRSRMNNPFDHGLVVEGSAILPELVSEAAYARVSTIWLTAPASLIKERILHSSEYEIRTATERRLIDSFIQRTVAIDRFLKHSTEINRQCYLDASSADVFETLRSLS
jgi:2-phosphoglycerate kinase